MAILQISKIQQRTGNLVDLPQLDEAEFGWATDAKKLFIGKLTPNENIEILTSYSTIDFNQINGAFGNLAINANTIAAGQVISYDGNAGTWTNKGRGVGGEIALGDVSNVKIDGGAIGYVLETDGLGNLAWTPKSAIVSYIKDITNASPAVVTTVEDNFFTNGVSIVITGIPGPSLLALNGNSYYVDVISSNQFSLYTDAGLTTPLDTTSLGLFPFASVTQTSSVTSRITVSNATPFSNSIPTAVIFEGNVDTPNTNIITGQVYYIADKNDGAAWIKISETPGGNVLTLGSATGLTANVYAANVRALASISGTGSVSGAGGANSSVQYNDSGVLQGSAQFTWDSANTTLRVTGNANVTNVNATNVINASRFVSNVATGVSPPLTVTSTDRVANLNVDRANVSDYSSVTAQSSGSYFPVFVNNSSSGNRALAVYSNVSINLATGNLSVPLLTVTSNASIGNLSVSGIYTGNGSGLTNLNASNISTGTIPSARLSGTYAINVDSANTSNTALTAGTVTTNAQPNITSVGTLSSLSVSGTVNAGTVQTTVLTTGANTISGTITGNWSLSPGSRIGTLTADLAELYESDNLYEPGLVIMFGGEKEVTLATPKTTKVAGVVSTNPAFLMNGNCSGVTIPVALQGRVPCKVTGTIAKGDMMVSAGNGYAMACNEPRLGMVIGKALEDFSGIAGTIEIVVGRL